MDDREPNRCQQLALMYTEIIYEKSRRKLVVVLVLVEQNSQGRHQIRKQF